MPGQGWFNLETATNALPENQIFENESAFSFLGLTRTQRIWGFIICSGLGFVISLLGSILLFLPGFLTSFVLLYTLGLIISLVGTGFLIGFFKQLTLMFKPVRVVATLVFLGTMVAIFVVAFVVGNDLLCLILVIVEYLAYTWYCLSYIPYARTGILKLIGMA
ncbi:SFT2-domain-containing protein [Exidia glandulosa HHB12029]|uniref:Protein transport protein SFT2 n=1 Tax=Exidia glandulosa HHB12029 TaxID=1314781 RepID=A0A165ZR28_EXIGL|nr:SFT2-domain-containing protein [Exidia glandulosa HHB12029]